MAGGILILALTVIRFVVRIDSARRRDDRLSAHRSARADHPYGSTSWSSRGVATRFTPRVFWPGAGTCSRARRAAPADFAAYPTFWRTAISRRCSPGSIGLHVLAALYHHLFVRKDDCFRRIWFGRRL